ncbi:MAG TPA: YceI family protein, partial [Pirellulales bacterium]|nr:YceI family protein [Pirellulales bacterium]
GVIDLDEKNPAQNAFDITIDAESVDTGLVKRDEHLRGPDFFSAREFPEITFKSDSVRAKPDGIYEVVGKLKLHGVTKPLTVSLKKVGTGKNPMGMQIIGVDTGFTVKRTDFNMKNLLEGVGDEVLLIVSLEAGRK